MTKNDAMTEEERARFLATGAWRQAVFQMYQALAQAKAKVAEKDKRTFQLAAAAYADTVMSMMWVKNGRNAETKVKVSKEASISLWAIEEDAINALKKRGELNGIDKFHDRGIRMFRPYKPAPLHTNGTDPYDTF